MQTVQTTSTAAFKPIQQNRTERSDDQLQSPGSGRSAGPRKADVEQNHLLAGTGSEGRLRILLPGRRDRDAFAELKVCRRVFLGGECFSLRNLEKFIFGLRAEGSDVLRNRTGSLQGGCSLPSVTVLEVAEPGLSTLFRTFPACGSMASPGIMSEGRLLQSKL